MIRLHTRPTLSPYTTLSRSVEPVVAPGRPRTGSARTAIEEGQPRQVTGRARAVLDGDDLAREHGDLGAAWIGVIERHLEIVVGQDGTWLPEGRHAGHATSPRGGRSGACRHMMFVPATRAH